MRLRRLITSATAHLSRMLCCFCPPCHAALDALCGFDPVVAAIFVVVVITGSVSAYGKHVFVTDTDAD